MDTFDPTTGEVYEAPAMTHRWSPDCGEIFGALAKAQAEIKNAVKDSTNPHFKAKFADLASVKDACWEALTKNDIATVQMPVNGGGTNIGVVTLFAHKSGQWIESRIFVAPTKFDAQGAGSAITYLRRYALAAMAGVAPEDDDGNAAVGRPQAAPGQQNAARPYNPPPAQQAPSLERAEADKRIKELENEIANSMTHPDLDSIATCAAWGACGLKVYEAKRAEGLDEVAANNVAGNVLAALWRKIEQRKALLLEDAR